MHVCMCVCMCICMLYYRYNYVCKNCLNKLQTTISQIFQVWNFKSLPRPPAGESAFHLSTLASKIFLHLCHAGVVLEISLSSFQTACLSWTFAVRVQWDLRADFPVKLKHKFFERLQFSFLATKKNVSLYISSSLIRNKSHNTAIQPAVYALWNLVAEKGRTHCRRKILSGFWKPQKPL